MQQPEVMSDYETTFSLIMTSFERYDELSKHQLIHSFFSLFLK